MFFIDGRYFFATNQISRNYIRYATGVLRDRITGELASFNRRALDETQIFYRPQNTLAEVHVIVEEGREVFIAAEQYLKVLIYLNKEDHSNEMLKDSLRTTIATIVSPELKKETISADSMATRIKEESGVTILGIDVSGLGGDKNYLAVTPKDNSGTLSIRKKLTLLPDNTFLVEDDIDVDFKRHLPSRNAN
jgi:hypothetical protein